MQDEYITTQQLAGKLRMRSAQGCGSVWAFLKPSVTTLSWADRSISDKTPSNTNERSATIRERIA